MSSGAAAAAGDAPMVDANTLNFMIALGSHNVAAASGDDTLNSMIEGMKLEPGSRQGVVQHLFEAMKTFLGAAGRTDKISEMQQALIVFTQELTEESEERARQIIHDILQPAFIETVTKKVPEIQQETVTAESPWTVSGILSLVLMGSYVFFHLFMFSEGLPEFWEAYEGDSTHKFLKTSEPEGRWWLLKCCEYMLDKLPEKIKEAEQKEKAAEAAAAAAAAAAAQGQ